MMHTGQEWVQHLQRAIDALDGGRHPDHGLLSGQQHTDRRRLRRHRTEGGDGDVSVPRPAVSHGAVLGVVWAIDDHPELATSSAAAVCNAVRSAGRRRHAPWAVLDAVAKGSALPAVRSAVIAEVPDLVISTVPPVFETATEATSAVSAATAGGAPVPSGAIDVDAIAHAQRVGDILRSWMSHDDLKFAVVQAGDRLRYELFVTAEGGDSLVTATGSTSGTLTADQIAVKNELTSSLTTLTARVTAATGDGAHAGGGGSGGVVSSGFGMDVLKKEAIAKVLQAIAPTSSAANSAGGSGGGGGSGDAGGSGGDAGASKVAKKAAKSGASAVARVAELTRIVQTETGGSLSCEHCGLYFDDAEAKQRHSRLHYFWRSDGDKQYIRLQPLTADEFVRYDSFHADGSHVPTILLPSEMPSMSTHRAVDRLARKQM